MAQLPPSTRQSIREWLYRFGFREIEEAYEVAMESVQRRKASIGEWVKMASDDADSEYLVDQDSDEAERSLGFFLEAERSEVLIRNAFMIALFHFFERQCVRAMKTRRFEHTATMSWLEAQGYSPDRQQLSILELCVHCSKHGAGRSCDRLYETEPQLFNISNDRLRPSDLNLSVPKERLDKFFDAVRQAMAGTEITRRPVSPKKSASYRT